MLLQGCRRGAPGGDPPGATAATGVHLSDQRAHMGGSSSLGMSPEKKSLIFLPMSPIGLSSAWLGERGWWGVRVRLCLATSRDGNGGGWAPQVLRSCGGRARSAMGMRSGCTRANARPLGSSSRQARAPRRKCAGWPSVLWSIWHIGRRYKCLLRLSTDLYWFRPRSTIWYIHSEKIIPARPQPGFFGNF